MIIIIYFNMIRLLFCTAAIIIINGLGSDLMTLRDYDVIHVVNNHQTCSREDAAAWANDFVYCFRNKKYKSSPNLFNIVTRLLDHSKNCIKYATLECRPNHDGFILIMDKVIKMIEEYSNMHVERLMNGGVIAYAERDKIQDLNCVQNILTKDTYATCFNSVISTYEQLLGENETYDLIFQMEVEKAILCANKENQQCSKSVKIQLNKVVRYILALKQPEREDTENDPMSPELSKTRETPELLSEFRKIEKENISNNTKIPKLPDFTNVPQFTELSVTEKENIEDNIKTITKHFLLPDLLEEKDDVNHKFPHSQNSPNSTETLKTTEPTNLPKKGQENMANDTELSQDFELSETPSLFSMSTETLNLTEPTNRAKKGQDNMKNDTELSETLSEFSKTTPTLKLTKPTNSPKKGQENIEIDTELPQNFELSETSSIFPMTADTLKLTKPTNPPKKEQENIESDTEFPQNFELSEAPSMFSMTAETLKLTKPTNPSKKGQENMESNTQLSQDFKLSENSSDFSTSTHTLKLTESTNPTIKGQENMDSDTQLPEEFELSETLIFSEFPKSTELPKPIVPFKYSVSPNPRRKNNDTQSTELRNSTQSLKPTESSKPKDLTTKTLFRNAVTETRESKDSWVSKAKSTTTRKPSTPSRPVNPRPRTTYYNPPQPTEPPKPWYDFIVRPFVSLWRTIKSWFGF